MKKEIALGWAKRYLNNNTNIRKTTTPT